MQEGEFIAAIDHNASRKGQVGAPSQFRTPEIQDILLGCFERDMSVTQTCDFIGMSRNAFYEWMKDDLVLSDRVGRIRNSLVYRAKSIIYEAIKQGDLNTAKMVVLKRDPAYKEKAVNEEQTNTQPVQVIVESIPLLESDE